LVNQIIDTHAGIEIELLLKSFIAQLMAFYFLALDLGYRRQALSPTRLGEIITGLRQMPAQIETILESQERYILELTHNFSDKDFILSVAGLTSDRSRGALKLKEISYSRRRLPSGELKHGPIAPLDAKVPVVAIAMPGSV